MVGLRVSKKDTGHYCYDLLLLLLLLLLVYYFFYYYSRITHVCQTNKKDIPIQQKVPLLQKFHRWWLLDVQRDSLPQRCSKYGRFKSVFLYCFCCCEIKHLKNRWVDFSHGSGDLCIIILCFNLLSSALRSRFHLFCARIKVSM